MFYRVDYTSVCVLFESVVRFEQDQSFPTASAPFRRNVCDLRRKFFEPNGRVWFRDTPLGSLPETEPLRFRYPTQPFATIRHNEVHSISPHEIANFIFAHVTNAFLGNRSFVVPNFSQRNFCHNALFRLHNRSPLRRAFDFRLQPVNCQRSTFSIFRCLSPLTSARNPPPSKSTSPPAPDSTSLGLTATNPTTISPTSAKNAPAPPATTNAPKKTPSSALPRPSLRPTRSPCSSPKPKPNPPTRSAPTPSNSTSPTATTPACTPTTTFAPSAPAQTAPPPSAPPPPNASVFLLFAAAPATQSFRTERAAAFSFHFAPAKWSARAERNLSSIPHLATFVRIRRPAHFFVPPASCRLLDSPSLIPAQRSRPRGGNPSEIRCEDTLGAPDAVDSPCPDVPRRSLFLSLPSANIAVAVSPSRCHEQPAKRLGHPGTECAPKPSCAEIDNQPPPPLCLPLQ